MDLGDVTMTGTGGGARPAQVTPAAAVDPHGDLGLPAVVEELLVGVVEDGFTLYCCGSRIAPNALVACYEWAEYACVDVLTIRDFGRVTTARVPTRATPDLFAPQVVVWAYQGPAVQALRALLDLVHPAHPQAPVTGYPAPLSLHVPRAQQRPMVVRPPSPGRARARAERLAAAMAPLGGDRAISDTAPAGTPDPRLVAG